MLRRFQSLNAVLKHNPIIQTLASHKRNYWMHAQKKQLQEPFYPIIGKEPTYCGSGDEAVGKAPLKNRSRVFVHGAASTPTTLLHALCRKAKAENLKAVELVHIHTEGAAPQVSDEFKAHFKDNSLFIAGNVRKAVNAGDADFTPIFLSEIPGLFESPEFPIDIALIQVSPPDRHGYCSLGTSVDCSRSAIMAAKCVIGVLNKFVPRTHGDGHVHISHFDSVIFEDKPLPQIAAGGKVDENTAKMGEIIASNLIPDKACLQMGIGGIPDATLKCLKGHKDLGIHTEMFSDGVLDLIDIGVISNAYKVHHRGKVVSSFCMGSQKLYDFIHDNPLVLFCDCSYVNDTDVIRVNPNMCAINSCIEIDITGQVCADSIGTKMYSGIGGQMDFMRGAVLSENGRAIMALASQTAKGDPKILPTLKSGGGVVTTRAHVQFIVTENGFARLYGKTLRERAKLLIGLAHDNHKEMLEKAAHQRFGSLNKWDDFSEIPM